MTARKSSAASKSAERSPLDVDLALQGGGAHGAFTWGVLDRLLEETWLRLDGISGKSAGAMNAAVLASGYASGGAEGPARPGPSAQCLRRSAAEPLPANRLTHAQWLDADSSPLFIAMDLMARLVSPYDLTPFGGNPLAALLKESVDFAALADGPIKVFVTATNVRTGRGRVFRKHEITPMCCWHRPVCRRCSRPSRSMARLIGTVATQATPPSPRWYRMHLTRYDFYPSEPGRTARHSTHRTRHSEPAERGVVQRRVAERAQDDRPAARVG